MGQLELATVRIGHEQLPGSKLGKEYDKALYCHPAIYLFNFIYYYYLTYLTLFI